MNAMLTERQQELLNRLAAVLPQGRLAVALSGGVDSSVLVAAAARILGPDRVLAITVEAPMVPASDHADARKAASQAGVRQLFIRLPDDLLADPAFRENPPDRCYFCKKIIFQAIRQTSAREGFNLLADGTNADDLQEYRPGLQAIRELGVLSPFAAAGLRKAEVRELAAALCPDWTAKPAMACLATRIPHGTPVTLAAMRRIDRAEQLLRENGFTQVRVRDHQGLARLEIDQDTLLHGLDGRTIQLMRTILHDAGFRFATLDLDGYKTGSLQETGKDDHDHA